MAPRGRGPGRMHRFEPVFPGAWRLGMLSALIAALCLITWSVGGAGVTPLCADAAPDDGRVMVTLLADGEQATLRSDPVMVAELLASAGIALGELDRVEPRLDRTVAEGEVVRVVRVTREVVEREIEIPIATRARLDRRVHRPITLRPGRPGRALATLEVWRRDGVETQRSVISQRTLEPMRPQVVVRGTLSFPSRGGQVLYLEATGYDPGPRSCGRYASGYTAIGVRAGKGVAAVDPRVIPLGTRLYADGYGECIAADVGGAIKGRRIDLGFDTYRQALAWGRRTVRVRILE